MVILIRWLESRLDINSSQLGSWGLEPLRIYTNNRQDSPILFNNIHRLSLGLTRVRCRDKKYLLYCNLIIA